MICSHQYKMFAFIVLGLRICAAFFSYFMKSVDISQIDICERKFMPSLALVFSRLFVYSKKNLIA